MMYTLFLMVLFDDGRPACCRLTYVEKVFYVFVFVAKCASRGV